MRKVSSILKVFIVLMLRSDVVDGSKSITDCSGTDCICDISALVKEWKDFVQTLPKSQLMAQLEKYRCTRVKNLPATIQVHKRKVKKPDKSPKHSNRKRSKMETRGRFKRQIAYPATDEAFEQAVGNFKGSKGQKFALRGNEVTLPCFDSVSQAYNDEIPLKDRDYEWTVADGQPITSSQTTEDEEKGSLIFHSVELKDNGNYNCKVIYNSGSSFLDFAHQLSVISLPVFWLDIVGSYDSLECNRDHLDWMESEISSFIKYLVCPKACEILHLSLTCSKDSADSDSDSDEDTIKKLDLLLSISSGNLEKVVETNGKKNCGIKCLEILHAKFLQIILESMSKLFARPIILTVIGDQLTKIPIPEFYDTALMEGCTAGFYLEENLCFPCEEGTFSRNRDSECTLCERGTYQENTGSSECNLCEVDESTMDVKSKSMEDCQSKALVSLLLFCRKHKILLIILLFISLLILLILLLLSCCCYNSKIGRFLNKYLFCWCGCLCCFQNDEIETIYHKKKKGQVEKMDNKAERVGSKEVVNERSPFLPKNSVRVNEEVFSDIKNHRVRLRSNETAKFDLAEFDKGSQEKPATLENDNVVPFMKFKFSKASQLGTSSLSLSKKSLAGKYANGSGASEREGNVEVCQIRRKPSQNRPKNSPPPPPPPLPPISSN